jgi:cysteine desulfurase
VTEIYLDAHATTPCDPKVVEAMVPCFVEGFGNAASTQHGPGRRAARLVEHARGQVARLLGCEPAEIVFTSGATEADNLALLGVAEAAMQHQPNRRHLVTCAAEHKAVLDTCATLEKRGYEVTYLRPEADGRLRPEAVAEALREDTLMVSVMTANNEIGVVQPVAEIAEHCRERGVLLHSDAAQAGALIDCRVERLGVDLLSLSGHKMYGPQGIGALYVKRRRPRVRLAPQLHGGGHERGRRSGTLPLALVVGFGVACELALERRQADAERLATLRDALLTHLRTHFPDLQVNGSLEHRLPNNLNVSLPDLEARALLEHIEGVALASGSACTSASHDSSYVVRLLPGGEERADGALRFGLLRNATAEEMEEAARRVARAAAAARLAPPAEDPCAVACGVEAR